MDSVRVTFTCMQIKYMNSAKQTANQKILHVFVFVVHVKSLAIW